MVRNSHLNCMIPKYILNDYICKLILKEKKTPLRILPFTQKREMLKMNEKNIKKTQLRSPTDYIQYLSSPDLNLKTKYACIESLRVALTNNSLEWIQEFGTRGLKQVLSLLNECFRK